MENKDTNVNFFLIDVILIYIKFLYTWFQTSNVQLDFKDSSHFLIQINRDMLFLFYVNKQGIEEIT